VATMIAADDDW